MSKINQERYVKFSNRIKKVFFRFFWGAREGHVGVTRLVRNNFSRLGGHGWMHVGVRTSRRETLLVPGAV